MNGSELTPDAQADRVEFDSTLASRGCTCFISPPCSFCTHAGNPLNQAEDESCWLPKTHESPAVALHAEAGAFLSVDIAPNGRECTAVVAATRLRDGRIHIKNARDLLDTASALIKAFEDMRTRRAAVANASIPPENRP